MTLGSSAELSRDEGIRSDTSLEALAGLTPSFRQDGTITGRERLAAERWRLGFLLGSEAAAAEIGTAPLCRVAGRGEAASEPAMFGYAPVETARRALDRAGIGWADVEAVELDEVFAVQSLACIDAWGIDPAIVNTRGGHW